MTKTTSIIGLMVGFALTGASAAHAQAPSATESNKFLNISAGSQATTHTFTSNVTFLDFGETGTVTSNQTVNRGFMFDVSGGYRLGPKYAAGIGLWTARSSGGDSASVAAIPDPLVFGNFITATSTSSDLKQTAVGVNLQFIWMKPITGKIGLAVSGGPTILHVSQQLGSIAVASDTQVATGSVVNESKTSAKAFNVGVDVSYKVTGRYGAGIFIRYAGGEVDLPSVQGMNVGGLQIGGGVRIQL
jgi:hypothetical protein